MKHSTLYIALGVGGVGFLAYFAMRQRKHNVQYTLGSPTLPAGLSGGVGENTYSGGELGDFLPPSTPRPAYTPPEINVNFPYMPTQLISSTPDAVLPTRIAPEPVPQYTGTRPAGVSVIAPTDDSPDFFSFVSQSAQTASQLTAASSVTSKQTPTQITTLTKDGYAVVTNYSYSPGNVDAYGNPKPIPMGTTVSRIQ